MKPSEMTNDNEIIEDIVRELRSEPLAGGGAKTWLHYLADRIEAAHKREREAGAEAAQICGEIGEMIGREAAGRQPVTDCNRLGNTAKMREALSDACYAMFNFLKTQNGGYEEMAEALDKAKSALAEPPRNCDVGTAEEQAKKWYWRYHQGHNCHTCPLGPRKWSETDNATLCFSEWLQMPYEEGGAR